MFCSSCGTPLQHAAKFCPSCGAPQQQPATGVYGKIQAQLEAIPVVGTAVQRLNGLQVPEVRAGAGGPVATGPDLVWAAVYLVATLMSVWFSKWYIIPFVLAAALVTLVYAVRPGVSLVTRSIVFIAGAAAGLIGIYRADSIPDLSAFGGILLGAVAGRGIWGLLKENRTAGDTVPIRGKRLQVLIAGLVICLFGTMFQWEPDWSFTTVGSKRVGTIYTDSTGRVVQDNTWISPDVKFHFNEGGNGRQAVPWLIAAGALLLVFRNKPWPKWFLPALTFSFAMMLLYALEGLGRMIGIGVLLFFGGFGAIGWSLMAKRA